MSLPSTTDWRVRVSDDVQSLLPLSTGIFYIVASTVDCVVSRDRKSRSSPLQYAIRNATISSMVVLLTSYCITAALLSYEAFSRRQHVSEDPIVFSLGSILLWAFLISRFSSGVPTLGYPFWSCCVAYLAGESALLCIQLSAHVPIHTSVREGYEHDISSAEETRPLLHGLRDNTSYSAACNNHSSISESSQDTTSNEEISTLSQSLEVLKFAVPLLWPKDRLALQFLFIGVGLCLLADRLLVVYVPIQLGILTDILAKEKTLPWQQITIFVLLRLLESSGGISALRAYMWLPVEQYTYQRITVTGFNQVMDLSCDFHDDKSSGSVWHAINRGTIVQNVVRKVLFQFIPMISDLFIAVAVLHAMFGPYMGLITAAIIGLFIWSSSTIAELQKVNRKRYIASIRKEVNTRCEATNNWLTATYFNRIDYEKHRHSFAVHDRLDSELSVRRWSRTENFVQSLILSLGLIGACFIAVYEVSNGERPVGSFVMLLGYWAQLSSPLELFSSGLTSITLDLVDAEEFMALLKKVPSVADKPSASELQAQPGNVSFKDVSFSYDKRREVLNGITFEAQQGQTVALVGETGSGKSTTLKLLLRLYDPDRGTIEIGGQKISDVSLESLRNAIGVVPQDPVLFNDTLLSNLKYANQTATIEDVHNACAAVKLHDRFLSFPDGYETIVGERGIKLSGGELQRVAIARVLLKNPKFVLLDEATSAVDSETEAHIQHSLAQLTAGRTTLVIAHRLSTVIKADHILVLKDGSITERGTHESLIKSNGYYCRLWKQQVGLDMKTNGSSLKPEAPEFVPKGVMK
ncbi:ATP-binding cassette transporter, putative [Talaromyces stipitatus ATCC 10500]|uniref:ATP-binding cassette transporter, putative n=1 Tax=Talaromyces stipitatus (strain ATCC 10500 / CBS 375.48 / QM 6759 / NRRL 1006) TaxID=441959 RepID=B8M7I3_TALSN|nr:ATP-binding cassette transporter, putative [Talaromyces stipitatus ATCC 10500]EED19536.1 ATP-binding cassette transporter, putative [Talaromyces stipitatus ATCC 10500]